MQKGSHTHTPNLFESEIEILTKVRKLGNNWKICMFPKSCQASFFSFSFSCTHRNVFFGKVEET